jgi:hypothetical protein
VIRITGAGKSRDIAACAISSGAEPAKRKPSSITESAVLKPFGIIAGNGVGLFLYDEFPCEVYVEYSGTCVLRGDRGFITKLLECLRKDSSLLMISRSDSE